MEFYVNTYVSGCTFPRNSRETIFCLFSRTLCKSIEFSNANTAWEYAKYNISKCTFQLRLELLDEKVSLILAVIHEKSISSIYTIVKLSFPILIISLYQSSERHVCLIRSCFYASKIYCQHWNIYICVLFNHSPCGSKYKISIPRIFITTIKYRSSSLSTI